MDRNLCTDGGKKNTFFGSGERSSVFVWLSQSLKKLFVSQKSRCGTSDLPRFNILRIRLGGFFHTSSGGKNTADHKSAGLAKPNTHRTTSFITGIRVAQGDFEINERRLICHYCLALS